MAIVVESIATQSFTTPTGNDLTITKPTGLAVGDLMIACVAHFADISNINNPYTTPSGWTEVENSKITPSTDAIAYAVFTKVADSGDVSASDFTFSVISAQEYVGGCILRVSGLRSDTQLGGNDSDGYTGTSPVYTISLAPAQDNILYVATLVSGNSAYDATDITLNGTNPTWTQQFDTNQTIDTTGRFEVFTAIDTTPETSITTLTPTQTGSSVTTESRSTLAFFLGVNDVTGTLEFIEETDTAFDISGKAGVHGTLDFIDESDAVFDVSGEVDQPNRWTNDTKTTNTWTNEDK